MAGQDLTGNQISTTYKSLLKTTDNAELPTSGKVRITDGKGNDSSLFIAQGTGGAQVCGNFSVTGDSSAANLIATTKGTFANIETTGAATIGGAATIATNLGVSGTTTLANVNAVAGTFSGNIITSGSITAGGDVVAFSSSDKKLKDNLNKINDSENIINSLTGYTFDWNDKSDREGSDIGVIAQDVEKVLPTIVNERDDGYLAVDYIKLIPVLIEEVKRLNSEINELKNKN
jgi:hypothetical protein